MRMRMRAWRMAARANTGLVCPIRCEGKRKSAILAAAPVSLLALLASLHLRPSLAQTWPALCTDKTDEHTLNTERRASSVEQWTCSANILAPVVPCSESEPEHNAQCAMVKTQASSPSLSPKTLTKHKHKAKHNHQRPKPKSRTQSQSQVPNQRPLSPNQNTLIKAQAQ